MNLLTYFKLILWNNNFRCLCPILNLYKKDLIYKQDKLCKLIGEGSLYQKFKIDYEIYLNSIKQIANFILSLICKNYFEK